MRGARAAERESLVNERSRITNRMKSAVARLGVRGFKPHLPKAPERLAGLRTAEGTGLPANIIEEFRRDMARLALVREQISSIVSIPIPITLASSRTIACGPVSGARSSRSARVFSSFTSL
jgi:hypothetical protein